MDDDGDDEAQLEVEVPFTGDDELVQMPQAEELETWGGYCPPG